MAKSKHRLPERGVAWAPLSKEVTLHFTDKPDALPTLAEYLDRADVLAGTIRQALDNRGTVTRGEVRAALVAFEQIRDQASPD